VTSEQKPGAGDQKLTPDTRHLTPDGWLI